MARFDDEPGSEERSLDLIHLAKVIAAVIAVLALAMGIVMLAERAAEPGRASGNDGAATARTVKSASSVEGSVNQSKRAEARAEIARIKIALDRYFLDNGQYPTAAQGLKALVKKPTMRPIPPNYRKGGYISHIPLDPWGHPYFYKRKREGCMLKSLGADGRLGGTGANADIDATQVHISGQAVLGR